LLAYGRWFAPGTPASSTTKTGRHDIAEILLKVSLSTKNQIISNLRVYVHLVITTSCVHIIFFSLSMMVVAFVYLCAIVSVYLMFI
jgi:hypothetical protein